MTERISLELADIGSLRARMKQLAAFRANIPTAPSPTTGFFLGGSFECLPTVVVCKIFFVFVSVLLAARRAIRCWNLYGCCVSGVVLF